MCGIAGIINLTTGEPIPVDSLIPMVQALRHRGPDESGIYIDNHIGLGHARLSIIDLSTGTQPIHNEDRTLWIIYNGEVFNYPELKTDLLAKGHRFTTTTDTEVLLHLYEEHEASMLDMLNGQFAFAIWDSKRQELFLARDRVGIIPLYHTVHQNRLLFASEIKSLFTWPGMPRQIDPISLDQIFTFWTTLPGRTAFTGINELPPGHYMRIKNGNVSVKRYWDLPLCPPEEIQERPISQICEEVKELLIDAVRIRLRADVPVGSYLSGGLDSSGLTAIVSQNFNNQLKTFGITFEDKAFDEAPYQEEMVRFLDVDHSEQMAFNKDIEDSLEEVLWHVEMPLLRTGPVPLYLLSRLVHEQGFKVVITGEGADEIFGGYNIFRETMLRSFWARQPQSKSRPELISKLYPYIFNDPRLKMSLQSFFSAGLDESDNLLFSHLIRWTNTGKTKRFFSDSTLESIGQYDSYSDLVDMLPEGFHSLNTLSRAQYLESTVFLSGYLLSSQGDRVAMANSVEMRPPYLDHRIMELMGQVASRWKVLGMNEKHLLKKVFQGILPDRIIARAKNPYRAPIKSALLRTGDGPSNNFLNEGTIRETDIFDSAKVSRLIQKLNRSDTAGEVDNMAFSGVLTTQIIHDKFISHVPSHQADLAADIDYFVDNRK